MITSAQGLAAIPDALSFEEAAPLLCAGITTFNALRHSGAMPGDLVAVQGLGGLGHLGIQYANKMGFETVAIGRGGGDQSDKKDFATKLGAHHYINTNAVNPAEALQKLGGAKTILATAPDSKSMTPLVAGLCVDGTLMVVGVGPDNIEVSPGQIVSARRSVRGWPSGTATDSEDAMRLAALSGIRPMIETFPLAEAATAYDRMISGKARFRVVLKMT
jgi:D-arabinose 1-dehydrogenase-like Zn-dependent alcohol dehydrogenase